MKIYLLIATSLFITLYTTAQTPVAKDIVKKSEDRMRGNTLMGEMLIKTVRPNWTREMEVKVWMKGTDYSLIMVQAPAKDKGTTFLKRKKEVWNWIPTLERSIKLPPSMMSQSWMGTDFTNDDLVKESSVLNDYTHAITGDSILLGLECYKIEMIPKPEAAVVWGKVVVWIDKKDFMQLQTVFYDEDGDLVNVMTGSDIKMMGGRLIPTVLEMFPVDKKGNKTMINYKSLVFDEPINDDFFSTQNMKQPR